MPDGVRRRDGALGQRDHRRLQPRARLARVVLVVLGARLVGGGPVVVLRRREAEGIREEGGRAHRVPLVAARVVVATRARLRHRRELGRGEDVAAVRHAVLHGEAGARGAGCHLREPRAREGGVRGERREVVELLVEPILLVHGEAPLDATRQQQIVPKPLLGRQRVPAGIEEKVVRAAVLLRVRRLVRPEAVVPLHRPPRLLVHVLQPVREHVGPCCPVGHAAAVRPVRVLVVPPAVGEPVPVRDALGLGVARDVEHRRLVVLTLDSVVVVEGAVVRRVPEEEEAWLATLRGIARRIARRICAAHIPEVAERVVEVPRRVAPLPRVGEQEVAPCQHRRPHAAADRQHEF